jgi:parallel beta-helix repeat protein
MRIFRGVAASVLLASASQCLAVLYYVDYAAGDDSRAGTAPSQSWKHAPGDIAATGVPATKVLVPGDVVRFRAGVHYRGEITMRYSGTAALPIRYLGTGWGDGMAVIDGADPVLSSVPCPSQAACGGAPNWTSLRLVSFGAPKTSYRKIYDNIGPLFEAQSPEPADPFFSDELKDYAVTPLSSLAILRNGRLENAALAALAQGQPGLQLSFWVQPNEVKRVPVTSVSGSTIYFNPAGLNFYTDRDGRVALVGSVKAMTRPGTYATLSLTTAVVFPRPGQSEYFVGNGRGGINFRGKSHITIRGFHFLRGTGSSADYFEGISVANTGGMVIGTIVEDNKFGPGSLMSGAGAFHYNAMQDAIVRRNQFADIEWGSGIRVSASVSDLKIERNRFNRMGRSGIYIVGASNGLIRNNILTNFNGIHGNAISLYLATSNFIVEYNCAYNSLRPITTAGASVPGVYNNNIVRGNILVTNAAGTFAISSWGGQQDTVTYQHNLALGASAGILLNGTDRNIRVTHNRVSGIAVNGVQPAGWVVASNTTNATLAEAASGLLTPTQCTMPGYFGNLNVGPLS